MTCTSLALPDGYNGHAIALGAINKVDGALVLLSSIGRPGFNRWARTSDKCVNCGQPVSAHLPKEVL